MTWRERIHLARQNTQGLTNEDRDLWRSTDTCPAAEAIAHYGLDTYRAFELYVLGTQAHHCAVYRRFDEAESLLDLIEDRALEIKRGMAAS